MPHNRTTSFGYRFAMIHRINSALARRELVPLGISTAQIPFLMELLLKEEPTTQKELSQGLFIDPAATVRILDQLEKKKMIKRWINPKNRREKLVVATPKARLLEDHLAEALFCASQGLVSGLGEKEQKTLFSLLDKILKTTSAKGVAP